MINEEREAELDKPFTVSGKRMRQIDKELVQAERIVLDVAEKWARLLGTEAAKPVVAIRRHGRDKL